MTMVSYAQNHEDVLLDRLFPRGVPGFYIDVGAYDPVVNSVTKHFYDLGWHGINVEPAATPFEALREGRGRDVNLNLGLSETEGTLQFFECPPDQGWSTFSGPQARLHRDRGVPLVERTVQVTTLAKICEEHVDGPIDFLSVDVEGHEREVLAGGDWSRWRPRVVLVEATEPGTSIPSHQAWEPILTDADYRSATFDGLNRYYVRSEDADLAAALEAPVNVLDDYIPHKYVSQIDALRSGQRDAERRLASARAVNEMLEAESRAFAHQLHTLRDQYARLEDNLHNLETAFDSIRMQYQSVRSFMAESRGLYESLYQDVSDARAQALAALALFDAVGEVGLGVARRLTHVSARFPRGSELVKTSLRTALKAKRKLARPVATPPSA